MKPEKSFDTLARDVRELLSLLQQYSSPEIDDMSARVEHSLGSAKRALKRSSVFARIGRYANSVDNYVTRYPRLGFLTGVMIGGAVMYAVGLLRPAD